MKPKDFLTLHNGVATSSDKIPLLPTEHFREAIIHAVENQHRLVAHFGMPESDGRCRLYAVLAQDFSNQLFITTTIVGETYPALTPDCPQAHMFERELAENWGVLPEGHPWLKPVRFHRSYRQDGAVAKTEPQSTIPGDYPFFQIEGEEIHEVAVGPIHAGVIQPGHFRFQCHGEKVYHLEIQLGYEHRGIEPALIGGPHKRSSVLIESIAGDTVIGHMSAYCQAVEALAHRQVSPRVHALRGVALELERLTNHIGDLGALANDVAFLPGAAYFGRLRGEFLNLTGTLTGNRYGRSLLRPGNVLFDLSDEMTDDVLRRVESVAKQTEEIGEMLFETPSVLARFQGTGVVTREDAQALGLVGPAGRACGLDLDVRHDHPAGIFRVAHIPVALAESGDVYGRAWVRYLEAQRSLDFLQAQVRDLPAGALRVDCSALKPEQLVVSLVEGWRGEIAHIAQTDAAGKFALYKIVDPSFHNWTGLAMALRNEEISDFPLCNKSFNLSYAGHDL